MIIFFYLFLIQVQCQECLNKKEGFYCLNRKQFIWCSKTNHSVKMTCYENTVCKCGYTHFNPCVFSFQTLKDCEGIPGDIIHK